MIEIPLSIVAWISVVLIQAMVHYVVFGARRQRIQQQESEEALMLETLSLSTNESFSDLNKDASCTELMLSSSSLTDHHHIVTSSSSSTLSSSRRSSIIAAAAAAAVAAEDDDDDDDDDDHEYQEYSNILRTSISTANALHSPASSRSTRSMDKEAFDLTEPSPFLLMQTGTDIIKVRALCFLDSMFVCLFGF